MPTESAVAVETVYVVDDDASMRKALDRMFRTAGFAVESFDSPAAFLVHELTATPCCAVLDFRMPGLDGIALHARLREEGRTLPVVFITGHGDVPTSVRAMRGGAVDFLEKPFEDSALIDAVRRAMRVSWEHAQAEEQRSAIARRLKSLTPREKEVFILVAHGLLNKVIAARLGTTEKTIKVHRGRVMEKMAAGSLAELVRIAERLDLVT
jgi:FixJ family two-component response regulator